MPNVNNYKQDVTILQNQYTKYSISRVVENSRDRLFGMEVPAEFTETLLQNNVEINLYTLNDNQLIYSDVISNATVGAIKTDKLLYSDGTSRTFLYLDFRKLIDYQIPVGRYSITLNFFKDEIGSYDDRILQITTISPSRQEVELTLTDNTQINNLVEFATPGIPARWIEQTLKQIFNQPNAQNIIIPTLSSSINGDTVVQQMPTDVSQSVVEYGFKTADGSKPGTDTLTQQILNAAYPIVLLKVRDDVNKGVKIFTSTVLQKYVIDTIKDEYKKVYSDSVSTPQKYRFKLVDVSVSSTVR